MKFAKISWERFEKDCLALATKIIQRKLAIDRIVAIARGGLVMGRLFSDYLELPISGITIFSYKNMQQKKETKITETPTSSFKNQTILIVDDVADSGRTFQLAVNYFKKHQVKKIYTAALYYKSHTQFLPDFVDQKIDKWIIYPYETRETYKAFVEIFGKKAKEKMLNVGFKPWQLANY